MAYVAKTPAAFVGRSVGTGQCVALVQAATGAPLTGAWSPGPMVKGAIDLAPGTAIATFDVNGRYGNHTDHTSHAAIYLRQDDEGITVIDQWVGVAGRKPASERTIFWASHNRRDAHPVPSNNGDMFYVVQ